MWFSQRLNQIRTLLSRGLSMHSVKWECRICFCFATTSSAPPTMQELVFDILKKKNEMAYCPSLSNGTDVPVGTTDTHVSPWPKAAWGGCPWTVAIVQSRLTLRDRGGERGWWMGPRWGKRGESWDPDIKLGIYVGPKTWKVLKAVLRDFNFIL